MSYLELTCIRCPVGCQLEVTLEQGTVTEVTGNQCRLGLLYAEKESTNPTRMVTTTIPLSGAALPVLPVKTSVDIPKKDMMKFMAAVNKLSATAPIKMGDIIANNVANTDADLVATRTIDKR